MKLQDHLRDATRTAQERLSYLDKELSELRSKVLSSRERIKRIGTEIEKCKVAEVEKKKGIRAITDQIEQLNTELDGLEQKRQTLVEQLFEFKEKKVNAEKGHQEVKSRETSLQKDTQQDQVEIQKIEKHEKDIESQKGRAVLDLRTARVNALKAYMLEVSDRITSTVLSQEQRKAQRQSYEELKRDRHIHPEIADLCDARDEWLKVLKSTSVPSVKRDIESNLKKIEEELNSRYPGALAAGSSSGQDDLIEELYYFEDELKRIAVIFPMPKTIWDAIAAGTQGPTEEIAMRILWNVAKSLDAKPGESLIQPKTEYALLIRETHQNQTFESDNFSLDMPGGGSLSVLLIPMPADVQEAMCHESAIQ
jgi:hypothetical protein